MPAGIMHEPTITKAPTEAEIKHMVDQLITPEYADRQAKALIDLLAATTSRDNRLQIEISDTAARHAFTKTMAYERIFERAYQDFTGFPGEGATSEPGIIEIAGSAG